MPDASRFEEPAPPSPALRLDDMAVMIKTASEKDRELGEKPE